MLENVMFYGQGAGSLATASAVVGDVVELAKNKGEVLPYGWSADKLILSDINEYETAFFVRSDQAFEEALDSCLAGAVKLKTDDAKDYVAYITDKMSRKVLDEKLNGLSVQVIRVM